LADAGLLLKADKILAAANAAGAGAIHPGYGFLPENPGFSSGQTLAVFRPE